MPKYANMSDEEAEAWVRGGGRPPSNRGLVYRPPETPTPRQPQFIAPHLPSKPVESLPDWPVEPVSEALRREASQMHGEANRGPRHVWREPFPEPVEAVVIRREQEVTPVVLAGHHGTLADYLGGCRCLDCTNVANEAAMLGTWKP